MNTAIARAQAMMNTSYATKDDFRAGLVTLAGSLSGLGVGVLAITDRNIRTLCVAGVNTTYRTADAIAAGKPAVVATPVADVVIYSSATGRSTAVSLLTQDANGQDRKSVV